jgi:hypothetical protein
LDWYVKDAFAGLVDGRIRESGGARRSRSAGLTKRSNNCAAFAPLNATTAIPRRLESSEATSFGQAAEDEYSRVAADDRGKCRHSRHVVAPSRGSDVETFDEEPLPT